MEPYNCVSTPLESVVEVSTFESHMEELPLIGGNIIDLSVSPCWVHKMELVTGEMVWKF